MALTRESALNSYENISDTKNGIVTLNNPVSYGGA